MSKLQIKISNTPGQTWKSVLRDSNIEVTNQFNHFQSSYIDGVVEELYERTKCIKYESVIPSVMHSVNHNLGTYDLQVDVLVQDPESLRWAKDTVSVEFISNNVIEIWLTESSNVKITIRKLFPL
jgi:hypothetical protein